MPRDLSKPLTQVELVVADEDTGLRLDHFLSDRLPWRSRSDLQRRIRDGLIRVNGQAARPALRLQSGMRVLVMVTAADNIEAEVPHELPLQFLFEDAYLLALNKAPGTVVHPVGRHVNNTLLNVLHARHARLSPAIGNTAPMIVHRLDKDTSGVLVFASDEDARRVLGMDFETRKVRKSYLALVHGSVNSAEGSIDRPIDADVSSPVQTKMCVADSGKPSLTHFQTLYRSDLFSLLRFLPSTGRQHQIRVHAEAMGHPLLCDRLYGVANPNPDNIQVFRDHHGQELTRQALHAEALHFQHPAAANTVHLHAPLAADLAAFLPTGFELGPPPALELSPK